MAVYRGLIGKGLTSSVLGDLKASGGSDSVVGNYGRNIRWINELSGDFTFTSSAVAEDYFETLGNDEDAITDSAQNWEIQPSAACGENETDDVLTYVGNLLTGDADASNFVAGEDEGRWLSAGAAYGRISRVASTDSVYMNPGFSATPTVGDNIYFAVPVCVNGWTSDGQFISEVKVIPGEPTTAIPLKKPFKFLPHLRTMKVLAGEVAAADVDLQIAGAAIDYARFDVSGDATHSALRSYIAVPPGAVLAITYLNIAVDTRAVTNMDVREYNASDLTDYKVLAASGSIDNTNTDIVATTASPWYIQGGKKGKLVVFYITSNDDAATTDITITAKIDFFAEWRPNWVDKAEDILAGRGRDF